MTGHDQSKFHQDMPVADDCRKAEPHSWATTATGGEQDDDVDLGELEVSSDTDEPKLKVSYPVVEKPVKASGGDDMFDFDELEDLLDTMAEETAEVEELSEQDRASKRPENLMNLKAHQAPEHFAVRRREQMSDKPPIGLVVNGSRGDVQPFVALAQEFQRRSRRAILFTNYDFLNFCAAAGVEAVATFASWTDLFDELGGLSCPDFQGEKKISNQDILAFVEGTLYDEESHAAAQRWRERHPGCIVDPYEALEQYKPCVVLHALQSQNAPVRYEHLHKVPAVGVYFTTAFGSHFSSSRVPRPSLFATSTALDVRLPENVLHHITGPWLLEEVVSMQEIESVGSLATLKKFIEAGEKPVAIGWGSMLPQGMPATAMLKLALKALKTSGRRGIILGGWARLHQLGEEFLDGGLEELGTDHEALRQYAREKVCFVERAPHSWLYQWCRCVVNHGGSGTVHAALHSGCPVVVTPIYGDQFHFAQRVSKLGVGVGFQKSLRHIDHKELARAINKALTCVGPPRELAKRMKKDGGAHQAADIVEGFLASEVETGRFRQAASRRS